MKWIDDPPPTPRASIVPFAVAVVALYVLVFASFAMGAGAWR